MPDTSRPARRGRAEFDAAGRAASDELRAVFDNPYVSSHFDFLFGEYATKMAGHVRGWSDFFTRCRPAAFVANYHAPIYDVAAAVGIPCLGLTHALIMIGHPKWFTSLPKSSLIGALSSLHREKLIEAGVSSERIRVTGDPRADQLRTEAGECAGRPTAAEHLRKRLGIDPQRRMVLVYTATLGIPSKTAHLPLVDWAQGVRDLYALGALAQRHAEWACVIKCHPRLDHQALYGQVNRMLPDGRQFIMTTDDPLVPLVHIADAVCVWNTSSSALLEASLVSKPVMVFAKALIWYEAEERGCESWPHLGTIDELEAELEMLFRDPVHYGARVDQTRRAVRRYLGGTDESAISRCIRVLTECAPVPVQPR